MKSRAVLWALVADVVGIIVFVTIGRRNHDEGVAPAGVIETAAPFVIAVLVGWLLGRGWKAPFAVGTGAIIWVTTVAVAPCTSTFGVVVRSTRASLTRMAASSRPLGGVHVLGAVGVTVGV